MAVDAIELSFERDYITTFVLGTGDSDFTPLVHKLRELNKRVIGIGVEASTSALLPAACDEFLFYERLEGVEPKKPAKRGARSERAVAAQARGRSRRSPSREVVAPAERGTDLDALVTRTLAGLSRSSGGPVLASMLKRAILRKEPTFSEADHGFRSFGELLRTLGERGVVEVHQGSAPGDPEVTLPTVGGDEDAAFELLRETVERLAAEGPGAPVGTEDPGAQAAARLLARSASATARSCSSCGRPGPRVRRDGARRRRRGLPRPTRTGAASLLTRERPAVSVLIGQV